MSPQRSALSPARRVLYALLPALLLLCMAEGVARLAGAPTATDPLHAAGSTGGARPDAAHGWALVPGQRGLDPVRRAWLQRWSPGASAIDPDDRVNAYGFRDAPLAYPEPEGQRRVLAIGDSSVFGSGVAIAERFTERVERALDPAHGDDPERRAVELLNGGVPGWTLYPSLQQVEDSLDLGIDAIVAYNMNSDLMVSEGDLPDHRYFTARHRAGLRALATRSRLLQWLSVIGTDLRAARHADKPTRRVPLSAYREALADLVGLCHDEGLGLVFIAPPSPLDLRVPHRPLRPSSQTDADSLRQRLAAAEDRDSLRQDRQDYLGAMALAAWDAGVSFIDGPLVFSSAYRADPGRYQGADALFVDEIHPSAAGHALLAEQVAPVLAAILPQLPDHRATRAPPVVPLSAADPAVVPSTNAALDELRCDGNAAAADASDRVVALEVEGLPEGRSYRIHLLQDGLQASEEVATALCPAGLAFLHLPTDTDGVRITGLWDRDDDGPCQADLAAAGVPLRATEALDRVTLRFGPPADALPWAPPYGLPYGLLRLLAELQAAGLRGPLTVEVDGGLAGRRIILDNLATTERIARDAGMDITLAAGACTANAACVRVTGLAATTTPDDAEVIAGWTDPAGAAWAVWRVGE